MVALNKLRGLIKEKFNSESAFSEAIGINRSYLSELLNGLKPISLPIAKNMAQALELDADTIKLIFFS